ncbi:MAG: insulinase family protein [Desulfobacterales bacterium]
MNTNPDKLNPALGRDEVLGNHAVRRDVYLENLKAHLYELEHLPTGAQHIHISRDDAENTFAVGFKTVPADSTGVAHILEHTVLCGSRKFPVRDPFFSMLKRSLNTFMNAFTASDWTLYPYATQNKKDYYNLMDVYLDAAFFPIIGELSFKQEGHRLEVEHHEEAPEGFSLLRKGVVYNEMKGAMSSPQQVMFRSLMNALYPDTTYQFNSGGDPAEIPKLTHEQLVAFHRRHYHPGNAFFYTYGNLPLVDHLRFIEEKVLHHFDKIDPDTEVPSQPRWREERTATYAYPLSKSEDPETKNQVCMGWLCNDIKDTFDVLSLSLLERILLGNAASPLRKALIESGLGSSLSDGTGYERDHRDTMFACGLKDTAVSDAPAIRDIIFDTLTSLCTDGIDKEMIDSAIHQMEFRRKEVTNTPYPYGIKLLLTFGGSWFHGADPVRVLLFDEDIQKIKARVSQGPFFENLIRRYFLDNHHRVFFTLTPDSEMEENESRRVASELDQIRKTLTDEDIQKIRSDQEALARLQNAEEDPSSLPTLAIEDIPPEIKMVSETPAPPKVPVTAYNQPTSGILYNTTVFHTHGVDRKFIPLMPVFSMIFSKAGTRKHDYMEMARLIDAHTGGIGMAAHARMGFTNSECISFVSLRGKCLNRNIAEMFDLLGELLVEFEPSNLDRIRVLLKQYRASMESSIVQNGHRLALSLASRNFSPARWMEEIWHGITQLLSAKKITGDLGEGAIRHLCDELVELGKQLLAAGNMETAVTGEEEVLENSRLKAAALGAELPYGRSGDEAPKGFEEMNGLPFEGWHTSSAVSFVAGCFQTVRMTHADAPALFVISKMLRSLYLHREIREKGGAYGGFAVYNLEDGIFGLASYRDPHIVQTLKVYDGVEDFLKSGRYHDEDIKEAILQCCSEIDKPDAPGEAGLKAFYRRLIGMGDEQRRSFKQGLLAVTREQVAAAGEAYFNKDRNQRAVAVISSLSRLEEAAKKLDRPLSLHRI